MSEPNECARNITWAGQTYSLNLNHPWVRNVLSYCGINGKPPATVLLSFESGAYSIDEVERILELGLVGGGMAEREADKILDIHVRNQAIATNAGSAAALLVALFVGNTQ